MSSRTASGFCYQHEPKEISDTNIIFVFALMMQQGSVNLEKNRKK